ncbi:precorrin-2 C(20)-methyltransferase [Egbenema bharatensis]|uniref:precorrin-2 C(20)-methyltransferase n=1 Tax=Egbenema bharatensis TaxID=3463334 RepID=UPI003A8BEA5B
MGILYGISVGTGDPELMTLKGLRLLKQSPVVAFPAGVRGNPGLAEQIVSAWLQPHQTHLPLHFPYVQDESVLTQAWQAAADRVWTYLQQGDVAFACEGDISFYSTFTYLAQTLQATHPEVMIQTVPGICSPMAAASALGIPLTVRRQRLVVLPALYTVSDLEAALSQADVLVLMKVSSVYEKVWAILQQHQLLQHSHVVVRATQPNQQIYSDLRDRPHLDLPYFSLLVVQVHP